MFKMIRGILIMSVLLVMIVIWAKAAEHSVGYISFVLGTKNDVKVQHAEQSGWRNIRLYEPVKNKDQIKTHIESRCEVKLDDGSVVRIGENSNFKFSDISYQPKKRSFKSFLNWGRLWIRVPKTHRVADEFQIIAPSAVCAVRGTVYRIDADSTTRIMVYDGAVDVGPNTTAEKDNDQSTLQPKNLKPHEIPGPQEIPGPYEVTLDQWIRIVKGFQIEIRPDGKYAKSRINENLDNQSDWVRWNKERDMSIKY